MPINWFTTDQYQQMHGVKVAVYGPAGSGKTHLIKTMNNPFVLSIESGMLTLRKSQFHGAIINGTQDLKDVLHWLQTDQNSLQFTDIAIDSVSELAEKILDIRKLANKDPRKAYGEMQEEIVPLIKAFRDLPGRNVLFTFKEEYIKDEFTGQMKWAPSMPGRQLVKDVPYWFDEVFRAGVSIEPSTGAKVHYLQCQKIDANDAKDRSSVLNVYEEPNLTNIFNKIANS